MHSRKLKRVLVTGGAGFLGSFLCETLLQTGNQVICLDNLYTGSKETIAPLFSNKNFEWIEHDICDPIDLKVDQIYNLACPASPKHYQKDPIFTLKTCVQGSIQMLELALRNGASILQASTSEVYGDPTVHPQIETYLGSVNSIGERGCYDEGKRCAETLFSIYRRKYGLDCKLARIFNTYGPRMDPDDGRVISNFILQALKNEPLTIYGKGNQTRSFCYVSDLIEGLMVFMNSPEYGPFNFGNPKEITILELARQILSYTGSDSPLDFAPLPADDPKRRQPSIDLVKQKLGWEPKVSLEKGLKDTIAYFSKKISIVIK